MRSSMIAFAALAVSGLSGMAQTRNADETVTQTALAIPRIGMPKAPGVALPQPLTQADTARIRRIFALQRAGSVTEATQEMDHLESDLLRGAILADRYLSTGYLAGVPELTAWLARFGDQPDAPAVRALLETLAPRHGYAPAIRGLLAARGKNGKPPPGVPARALLTQNKDDAAVQAALPLLAMPAPGNADSLFSGGVAAWRLGEIAAAKPFFEAAWHVADSPALRSAAAFWTARVDEKAHDRGSRIFWLRRAARETDTFYSPIARRALSPLVACLQSPVTGKGIVTNADVEALLATTQGRRAFALLQAGERRLAEAELRGLWLDTGPLPALGRSLMLVAGAVDLRQFANDVRDDGAAAEAAAGKFELPLLRPAGGFRMDPAFVYAVVRHESNFQPLAVSSVGARGLMQVMPATAVAIGAIGEGQTDRLNDPATNLAIGQRYLIQLGDDKQVRGDLLKLIAAYGQGPTGMNRWADGIRHDGDPFVFLEAIPSAFMRQFVEDVLIYHWQYAGALRLRASSLDDLAAGIYPRFAPIKDVPGGMKVKAEMCEAVALKG